MNEFLAELYGTRENIGQVDQDDTEKLAQAHLLNEFFEAEGVDVDQLDDGTVVKVAEAMFGGEEAPAATEAEPEIDEEFQAKLAEADLCGRVMAHSYMEELNKEASAKEKMVEKATAAGKWVKGKATGAKDWAKSPVEAYKRRRAGDYDGPTQTKWESLKGAIKENKPQTATAAGLAALPGVAYGASKAMSSDEEKTSSAFEALAMSRAQEILEAAAQEQEQDPQEKLAAAVNQRALELLSEAGYLEQ